MITMDGKWIMEGKNRNDPDCIKSHRQLTDFINEVGFLPLFKNGVEGFSVEEMTPSDAWWAGKAEEDPWEWRQVIAEEQNVAYGKLFCNKAGFISREWYPYFAAYRREGYDFDSRYEDGLASHRTKLIIDVLSKSASLPSNEIKAAAGFGKEGEKGFDGAMSQLQMQTYITVNGFRRKCNKKQEEYGWSVAYYTLSENLFGAQHVRSAYHMGAAEAKSKIISQIKLKYPEATEKEIEKVIR
jgi:hypothetical protein